MTTVLQKLDVSYATCTWKANLMGEGSVSETETQIWIEREEGALLLTGRHARHDCCRSPLLRIASLESHCRRRRESIMFVCLVNEKGYNVNGSCLHHN